jgi:hypothetical protein
MTSLNIAGMRLVNQQIANSNFKAPHEIVTWMVAMQAQEYAMAKWAIGLRSPGLNDAVVEKAINDGSILRTHLMRPTWHFVAPEDIRWMLELTGPRVIAISAFMHRQTELDTAAFKKCNNIIIKTLKGNNHLTRTEIKTALEKGKINAQGQRLAYIMMNAEQQGIICSGARKGKQFTYALLDERVPATKKLLRQEAINELSTRYFASRGPATIHDFATWSGLTVKDCKDGAAMLNSTFLRETVNEKEYIFSQESTSAFEPANLTSQNLQTTFLMPDYDEYGMSYKDRSAILNPALKPSMISRDNPIFNRMIILNGIIVGSWQRSIKNNSVTVDLSFFKQPTKKKQIEVFEAVQRYSLFVGKEFKEG